MRGTPSAESIMLAEAFHIYKPNNDRGGRMPEQNIALELADVEFRRRGRVILTKVNLKINKGEKWVLFGPTASANPAWFK